jgi:ribosomal protein L11 methylase PrmA
MAAHQPRGGIAILSGVLTRQTPGVLAVYRGCGYARIDSVRVGEWTTSVLRRG